MIREYEGKGQIGKGYCIENLCNAELDCLCENVNKLNLFVNYILKELSGSEAHLPWL